MAEQTILVRFTGATFVATIKGCKTTASNSRGARQAAEALARKLKLDPARLRDAQRDLLRDGPSQFIHPGEAAHA